MGFFSLSSDYLERAQSFGAPVHVFQTLRHRAGECPGTSRRLRPSASGHTESSHTQASSNEQIIFRVQGSLGAGTMDSNIQVLVGPRELEKSQLEQESGNLGASDRAGPSSAATLPFSLSSAQKTRSPSFGPNSEDTDRSQRKYACLMTAPFNAGIVWLRGICRFHTYILTSQPFKKDQEHQPSMNSIC